MLNNPTHHTQWKKLQNHYDAIKEQRILSFFDHNENRVTALSQTINNLFFDYSKQHITEDTISLLCDLARVCNVEEKRDAMFSGQAINVTENRAVLHTALRDPNASDEIKGALDQIEKLSIQIRNKDLNGATGKPIEHIISLGVGGSDLGPRFVCDSLKTAADFSVSFVSNIDPYDIENILKKCNPETTLFIVISKSFGTHETMENYKRAKSWLKNTFDNTCGDADIMQHFIAVSANKERAQQYGFKPQNILPIWEWVNGRFSVWSAVGLPIAIALGFDQFKILLAGAHKADLHFKEAPLAKNIPVLMGLIGLWNINFMNHLRLAVLPYTQQLYYLPAYLQQLDMESNGKSVDLDGNMITDYHTGPVLFGEVGTNGQHSFYQHFHQGTQQTACDFIGYKDKNPQLLHNMLAQSEALMMGQEHEAPHQYFKGNSPSSTFLFETLNAETLGMLIAFYEHKVTVQGFLWNINSFDQFGVELGKQLAQKLNEDDLSSADPSTKNLYSLINKR